MSSPVPSSLFFLVPVFSLCLFYIRGRLLFSSYFIFSSLSILALFTGALGIASQSPPFTTAQSIFATLLRFELGASFLHLFNAAVVPNHILSPLVLSLFNLLFSSFLFSATLSSLLASCLSRAVPQFLAPLLTLLSNVLPIPFLAFILLFSHNNTPATYSPPSTTPPLTPREKIFQSTRDEPLTVYLRAIAKNSDNEAQPNHDFFLHDSKNYKKSLCIALLSAQFSAVLFSAFTITLSVLSNRMPQRNTSPLSSAFDIIQSVFIVLWTFCIMYAFLLYSFLSPTHSPAPPPPFTPPPSRVFKSYSGTRTPPNGAGGGGYHPARLSTSSRLHHQLNDRPLVVATAHPSTPTPSHLTEDFMCLRDPFASPNAGIVTLGGGVAAALADVDFDPPPPPLRHLNRNTMMTKQKSKSMHASFGSSPTKLRSNNVHRKAKRKGSSQALLPHVSSPMPLPLPLPLPSQDTAVIRFPSGSTSSTVVTAASPEDVDFDPEEAFLTQLLLMNLDSQSQTQSPSQPLAQEAGTRTVVHSANATTNTNRFTQDSTSTGRTLCGSDVFKLTRGASVSTGVSSLEN